MTYNDLVQHFGTDIKAAAELGFSVTTMRNFKDSGIPRLTQFAIQALTDKALMADELFQKKV